MRITFANKNTVKEGRGSDQRYFICK